MIPVSIRTRAWDVAARVLDPELPVVTIADLGILRDVTEDDQRPGARPDHPDLLRLPGHGDHPRPTWSRR